MEIATSVLAADQNDSSLGGFALLAKEKVLIGRERGMAGPEGDFDQPRQLARVGIETDQILVERITAFGLEEIEITRGDIVVEKTQVVFVSQ